MGVDGLFRSIFDALFLIIRILLYPINWMLSCTKRNSVIEDSCLHIAYMVHIPWRTVDMLRKNGWNAKYLAIGKSPTLDTCDYHFIPSRSRHIRRLQEFYLFWTVVVKYEVIHSYFLMFLSESGWEDQWLKRMGRKIVVNYRGCDLRDRKKNLEVNPDYNICDECDYGMVCEEEYLQKMRKRAKTVGDLFLVTTPDMIDFDSRAIHFPFFTPEMKAPEVKGREKAQRPFKVVHATNHPGIEGTGQIREAIDNLIKKGYDINFVQKGQVPYDKVIEALADADLAIGKMKMGYYANNQIESMVMGVPTITYVRPEYITEDLRESGFILTDLHSLEKTLQFYLDDPVALEDKRRKARASILKIHDNKKLAKRLIDIYGSLRDK